MMTMYWAGYECLRTLMHVCCLCGTPFAIVHYQVPEVVRALQGILIHEILWELCPFEFEQFGKCDEKVFICKNKILIRNKYVCF